MNATTKVKGHLCALFCVIVWGVTFIVSTNLLAVYTPIQTMLMRFILAYVILWLLHPKWYFHWKDELAFLFMSLFSNTLYFMAENSALTLTQTSNVSILVSTAPLLTALLLAIIPNGERITRNAVFGIVVAFVGMVLVVFNGTIVLKLNPAGDFASLGAALSWAIYSLILQRYSYRFSSYLIARKLMFYGILTSLPLLFLENKPMPLSEIFAPKLLLSLLFLGIIGSALCYVAWNSAADTLGVLHTTIYIYAIPFVTMVAAFIFLRESITVMGVCGALLIVCGMVLSSKTEKAPAIKNGA